MSSQVATFRINKQLYGIELGFVQEFVERLPATILPDNDNKYIALANLRGQIISLLDLKYLLTGESSADHDILMIIRNNRSLSKSRLKFEKHPTSEEPIGLIIDERGSILDIDPARISSKPEHGSSLYNNYYKYVVRLDDEVLVIIDLLKTIGLQELGASK